MTLRLIIVVSIGLYTFNLLSTPAFCEAETPGNSSENDQAVSLFSLNYLQKKLEETRINLQQNKELENEESAMQLGVTIDHLEEKSLKLQEIESVYQQLQTAMKRQNSLEKDKSHLAGQLQSKKENLISQEPPFNLSFYDRFLHQYDVAMKKEEASRHYLELAKKGLEESHVKMTHADQNLRLLMDKDRSGIDTADPPAKREWTVQLAALEEELLTAQYNLEKIIVTNIGIETNISEIERMVIQHQADWVGSHLVYDEKDLLEKLKLFENKKEEIKERVAKLSKELQATERGRLRAEKKLDSFRSENTLQSNCRCGIRFKGHGSFTPHAPGNVRPERCAEKAGS